MTKKVIDYHDIAIDGLSLSGAINVLSLALETYGDNAIYCSGEGGETLLVERDETHEEYLDRMRRETTAWKAKIAYEDAAKIRARNTLGVQAYEEWERNRRMDVE